ncbi:MAG: hypothetical protein HOP19_26425 [Acidobacteria bacterium]|nr:hypothetical protein [Acidobacteriota bacterium]
MSKFTSKFFSVVLACVVAAMMSVAALAQGHPVEGEYATSSTSAELGTITYVMVIKKNGDQWMCEIKDSPIPLTVSKITVDADNNVNVTADAGGTTVELKGKLVGEKMAGNWTAGDMKGTFEATKKGAMAASKAAPVATAPAATAASAASLEGTYDFKVVAEGQGELPFVIMLKKDGDKYKVEVPNAGDMTVTDVKIEGENVTFNAAYQGNGPIPLKGTIKPGEMGGKWEFSGFSGTWSAKKK